MTQVKMVDVENDVVTGGIIMDDSNVLCACCGGLIENDEIGLELDLANRNDGDKVSAKFKPFDPKKHNHKIIRIYPTWIDFTEAIVD